MNSCACFWVVGLNELINFKGMTSHNDVPLSRHRVSGDLSLKMKTNPRKGPLFWPSPARHFWVDAALHFRVGLWHPVWGRTILDRHSAALCKCLFCFLGSSRNNNATIIKCGFLSGRTLKSWRTWLPIKNAMQLSFTHSPHSLCPLSLNHRENRAPRCPRIAKCVSDWVSLFPVHEREMLMKTIQRRQRQDDVINKGILLPS